MFDFYPHVVRRSSSLTTDFQLESTSWNSISNQRTVFQPSSLRSELLLLLGVLWPMLGWKTATVPCHIIPWWFRMAELDKNVLNIFKQNQVKGQWTRIAALDKICASRQTAPESSFIFKGKNAKNTLKLSPKTGWLMTSWIMTTIIPTFE